MTNEELKAIIAAKMADPNTTAEDILSTILAALQEPTEGMKEAWLLDMDRWVSEEIEDEFHPWRVMLAASALGEKSE